MSERIKELREWGTFLLTLLTLAAVPVGALILHDHKLQIERDADAKYATQTELHEFQNVTNAKLDTLNLGVAHIQTDVAVMKEKLSIRTK